MKQLKKKLTTSWHGAGRSQDSKLETQAEQAIENLREKYLHQKVGVDGVNYGFPKIDEEDEIYKALINEVDSLIKQDIFTRKRVMRPGVAGMTMDYDSSRINIVFDDHQRAKISVPGIYIVNISRG